MRFLILLWALVELLQIVVIGVLLVGFRNLQRRLDAGKQFEHRPPRSVTDE